MRAAILLLITCVGCAPSASQTHVAYDAARFDAPITRVLERWRIPGAAVAVTHQGALVIAHAYGHYDREGTRETTPTTRFRIASLTKPVTAVAIHLLHQEGRLDLDARVFELLALTPPEASAFDPRWRDITVRHLLQHAGGFDREASFDPMFANRLYAKDADRELCPDDLDAILRFMLRRPLDFTPGERQAYSNFGYALLGRVIARVAGAPYEVFIRDHLLGPMGITHMEVGRERPEDRPEDEAFYVPDSSDPMLPNLFTREHALVSPADGGFFMRPMEAHGGLIASVVEYARFLVHVDGAPSPRDVLDADEYEAMLARPERSTTDDEGYYADGWDVIPREEGRIISHTGAKPGTTSIAVCLPKATCYVALVNARPLGGDFVGELDQAILDALDETPEFPRADLFGTFGLPMARAER